MKLSTVLVSGLVAIVGLGYVIELKEEFAPKPSEPIPDGYMRLQEGVYGKWCQDSCKDKLDPSAYSTYFTGLEIWCKSFECGQIYAEVNFQKDGVTVDYDNELITMALGERAVLTFESDIPGVWAVKLADFSAYGF